MRSVVARRTCECCRCCFFGLRDLFLPSFLRPHAPSCLRRCWSYFFALGLLVFAPLLLLLLLLLLLVVVVLLLLCRLFALLWCFGGGSTYL